MVGKSRESERKRSNGKPDGRENAKVTVELQGGTLAEVTIRLIPPDESDRHDVGPDDGETAVDRNDADGDGHHPQTISGNGRVPRAESRRPRRPQADVDKEIRRYFKARSISFQLLQNKIEDGDKQARREARRIFGRNAVAKAIDCGQGTVSKSTVYQEAAKRLGIGRRIGSSKKVRTRVGPDIADEEKGVQNFHNFEAEGDSEKQAVQIEILSQIRDSYPKVWDEINRTPADFKSLLERVADPGADNSAFWEIIQLKDEQLRDDRSRKVFQSP